MPIHHHRQLIVWERSIELAVETYALTCSLPNDERFGLVSQMRRAAVSIPSNIAEGHSRLHRGDYVHHLSIGRGSNGELDTQFELCRRLGYLDDRSLTKAHGYVDEVRRMLGAMIVRLKR